MGGEHDRNPFYSVEDNEAAFPYSFAFWTNVPQQFQTMVARALGHSKRGFFFANPTVLHPDYGVPLGTLGATPTDVSMTIEVLASTMCGFRGPKCSTIFFSDFERGTLAKWSAVEVSP